MDHATDLQAILQEPQVLSEVFTKHACHSGNSEMPDKPGSCGGDASVDRVIHRVGQLTRALHNNLRALGYDKLLEKAAAAIPDARDRLSYIATMTEQAALRTLNATDVARPIQAKLAQDAKALSNLWEKLYNRQLDLAAFKDLAARTRAYLAEVPQQAEATNAQLMEIMMAQDFQDLTGQVIKKITDMAQSLEQELLKLLLDYIPPGKRAEAGHGLLNGPVVCPDGRNDIVTSQNQVDELLESLGF